MLRTIIVAAIAATLAGCGSPEAATPQAALAATGGHSVDNPFEEADPKTPDSARQRRRRTSRTTRTA